MQPLGPGLGALGVGDQLEVADDPAQPGWVQALGRLQQDRFGLDGGMGRSWVPAASTAA
jgi:hypothetical protein